MKQAFFLILLMTSFLVLDSCASKKDLVYFQGVDALELTNNLNYTPLLKADDKLSITVASLDNEAAIPFNLPVISYNSRGDFAVGTPQLQTYLIAKDGTIDYPQLGQLQLAGLTRLQAQELLKNKLKPFLVNPIVNLRLLNFKVTVLGEVKRPGTYDVQNERITVLEALGLAGDLTVYGTRQNVLVVREAAIGKTYERIDLTSSKLFDSPVYYLQQNDVVYIEPNQPKVNSSTNSSTNGIIISAVSLLLTIISITLR
jgi:polysaccharide export outer membrane protein